MMMVKIPGEDGAKINFHDGQLPLAERRVPTRAPTQEKTNERTGCQCRRESLSFAQL
jgi:hypothetical protein